MIKLLRMSKTWFFILIFIWFLTGSVVFKYSVVNAQNQNNQEESFIYLRLISDVIVRLRNLYVDELSVSVLIENAIEGMYGYLVEQDSTYVRNDDFREIISEVRSLGLGSHQETLRFLRLFQDELFVLLEEEQNQATIKDLVEAAIEGMLSDLDPHTNFFRPSDFKRFTDSTMGEFGGLGIQIDRQGDYVTVVSPIQGTPAYKMGIQTGDRIVTVDNENVIGMLMDDVISRMRGQPGTRVLIGIERPGLTELLEFDIVREIIPLISVPYSFVLDNGVGYVRITQFNNNTTKELMEALNKLEEEGIRGLLVDLRSNPGGLLNEAVDTVNEFIGGGKLVVFSRGRIREANREYHTMHNRKRADYPVVTLINQASASASEIFAGSLQDWDRGLVVGMPSYGKGSVQQLFPLVEGHGLKVTISKYYLKSGRSVHKELNDRLLKGEDVSQEEIDAIDRENEENIYFTLNGRQVIGGGGVIPDIEIEQSFMTNFERDIRRLNLFLEFSMDYFTSHRESIEMDFKPSAELINEFLEFGESKGLSFTPADVDSSMTFIEVSLTRDILSRKFGDLVGYKSAIQLDTQLVATIELFDKFETLDEMFIYANEKK